MKFRKLSVAAAITASGALILSGCTPGGNGDDNGNGDDEGATEATAEEQQYTADVPEDGSKLDLGDDWETEDDEVRVSIGPDEFMSYNPHWAPGYNVYNSTINARLFDNFWYWGPDLSIQQNEDWGSYEVIEDDDPMVVEYTINDEVEWSDGTPVTAADYKLNWASQAFAEDAGFNPVSATYGEESPEGPQAESYDDKTFTVEYPEIYADWEILVTEPLPAHVVAEQIGVELEELIDAIDEEDTELLSEAADFWNDEWSFDPGELPDPELTPSSGPYELDNWTAGEYVTLTANEDYWGTPPGVSTLVYQFLENAQHVQALENGDLHVVRPAETVDTRQELENLAEAGNHLMHEGDDASWEHLDYNWREGSIWEESPEIAEAFALCVPREQIVENLIQPVNENAEVLNAREVFTFEDDYEDYVSEAYDGRYDEVDVDGAAEILEEHDAEGTEIRIGHNGQERRHDTVGLIQASCEEAGFEVEDVGDAEFFADGGDLESGDWDIAMFAWASSGQNVASRIQQSWDYDADEPLELQNYGHYENETVTDLWNEAIRMDPETDEFRDTIIEIEQELWDSFHSIPLYVHPGLVGSDSTINNLIYASSQNQIVWNAEQWQRAAE